MKKYLIKIDYEKEVEAKDLEEAREEFWDGLIRNNETPTTFLADELKVKEINKGGELK